MYAHWFTYVCDDCQARETCGRGEISHIRMFNHLHLGHRTHINDFGQTGPSLVEFLRDQDRELAAYNRRQRLLRIFSLGRRGREPVKPWQPLSE